MWRDGAMTEPTPPFQRLSDHVASMAHSPEADRLAVRIARPTASGRGRRSDPYDPADPGAAPASPRCSLGVTATAAPPS